MDTLTYTISPFDPNELDASFEGVVCHIKLDTVPDGFFDAIRYTWSAGDFAGKADSLAGAEREIMKALAHAAPTTL